MEDSDYVMYVYGIHIEFVANPYRDNKTLALSFEEMLDTSYLFHKDASENPEYHSIDRSCKWTDLKMHMFIETPNHLRDWILKIDNNLKQGLKDDTVIFLKIPVR